ncbi:LlaJI family restriction endonuclease [Clostridium estertheticum]|uniref:LlaJI family restriction endonuclease n=1 Tax=Clostridium estertheticum TaxID=238834 RepID=UPI001C6E43CC|nr:LlaJI family restriction endonuclease [Clostridium estertheticum]MBW9151453.1 LlaJI family restriction endonuclease [Clostridium estertheticum]WLC83408.1 LlaJI family restriction endonuclease [Clostridium estertheticum]
MENKYVVKYFREYDTFTFVKLKMDLMKISGKEIDNEELLKIITILKNNRVIVQYRSKEESESYKENFNYDGLNYDDLDFSKVDPSEQQIFAVRYVGILIIKKYVFRCFPKYITTTVNSENFEKERVDELLKKIVNVLRIYNSRQERLFTVTDSASYEEFNFLDMAIFFLNDYLENGVYYNEKDIFEVNGDGNVNWNKTIDEVDVILSDRGPVYVELFTESTESDNNDFFKRLHLYIVEYCADIIAEVDLFDVLSLDSNFNFNFDIDKNSLGDDDYIIDKIQNEMGIQFITRKLKLLEKMHTFISQRNSLDKEYELSLYGTSHFHTVWESVCQDVLANQLYVEMRDLPAQSKLNYLKLASIRYQLGDNDERAHSAIMRLKETPLNKLIEKPIWHVHNSTKKYEGDKTYLPDLIQIYENNGILNFNILDAKYREFVLNSRKLDNAPGVEEITKQYLYQLIFTDLFNSYTFDKENIKITNSFIFPGDCKKAVTLGMAEIKVMRNIPLENITAVRLPADMIYDYYIRNIKLKNIDILI